MTTHLEKEPLLVLGEGVHHLPKIFDGGAVLLEAVVVVRDLFKCGFGVACV